MRRAADTSVARLLRSATRPTSTSAPGTSVPITLEIPTACPLTGESASPSPFLSISSLSAEASVVTLGRTPGARGARPTSYTPTVTPVPIGIPPFKTFVRGGVRPVIGRGKPLGQKKLYGVDARRP
jgi:hypothetical protein